MGRASQYLSYFSLRILGSSFRCFSHPLGSFGSQYASGISFLQLRCCFFGTFFLLLAAFFSSSLSAPHKPAFGQLLDILIIIASSALSALPDGNILSDALTLLQLASCFSFSTRILLVVASAPFTMLSATLIGLLSTPWSCQSDIR